MSLSIPLKGHCRLHRGRPSKPMLQPLPQTLDLDLFSLITSRRATPLVSNRSLIVAYEKMTLLLNWSRQFPGEFMVAISVKSTGSRRHPLSQDGGVRVSSGTWAFKTVVYEPMGDITLGLHLGKIQQHINLFSSRRGWTLHQRVTTLFLCMSAQCVGNWN